MNEIFNKFALTALLHDIPHVIKSLNLQNDTENIFCSNCFKDPLDFSFVFKKHTRKDLDNSNVTEIRILAEIIAESENLSLAKNIDSKGELSPLKSIFSSMREKISNRTVHDKFFHASEMSDDILLDTKSSKKDLYFSPSYQTSSFLDELNSLIQKQPVPSINSVYYLIKKYFWAITLSHHGDDFCFSLYDHLKMTCAISCCLYMFLEKNHKNILLSKNIDLVREKILDLSEPRYSLIKIELQTKDKSTFTQKFLSKSILLWASHKVIEKYNLNITTLFYINDKYSILLLPNISPNLILQTLNNLNKILFNNHDRSFSLTYTTTLLKGNDITDHFSSHKNISDILWNHILPKQNLSQNPDNDFLNDHFDDLFGPMKATVKNNICFSCKTDITDTELPYCKKCNPLFNNEIKLLFEYQNKNIDQTDYLPINQQKQQDVENKTGILYTFTTSGKFLNKETINKNLDFGFFPDTYTSEDKKQNKIKLLLKTVATNPKEHIDSYNNISQLHSYMSLTDIIMQFGIAKIIIKQNNTDVLYSQNSELLISADIFSLHSIVNSIHESLEGYFQQCPTINLYARLITPDDSLTDLAKLDTKNRDDIFFLFNHGLTWNMALDLFKTSEKFLKTFNESPETTRKNIIKLLHCNRPMSLLNTSALNKEHWVREFLINSIDPQLLCRWTLFLIKGASQ